MPRLFLANLGESCHKSDITRLFKHYHLGDIHNIVIKSTYGFVDMDDEEDCHQAIKKLNGRNFNGNNLEIQWGRVRSKSINHGGKTYFYNENGQRRGFKTFILISMCI